MRSTTAAAQICAARKCSSLGETPWAYKELAISFGTPLALHAPVESGIPGALLTGGLDPKSGSSLSESYSGSIRPLYGDLIDSEKQVYGRADRVRMANRRQFKSVPTCLWLQDKIERGRKC